MTEQAQRADRCGWRRRANSFDRWEMTLTLTNCTQGEIWHALQRREFLSVANDEDLNREWEYAITLAGETPNDLPERETQQRSQGYMDRMMRGAR